MIDSVMLWNEPNNKSHWDPEIDPDWLLFAEMAKEAGHAVRAANPNLTRVLGGISPIDPVFIRNMEGRGVLDAVDAADPGLQPRIGGRAFAEIVDAQAAAPVAQRIAADGYRVLVHDRRNCGASDVSIDGEGSEYEIWAEDLYAMLKHFNATPAWVGGGSSGCRMSTLLALRHPEAVKGLLLWRVTGGEFAAKRLANQYYLQFIAMAKKGGMAAVCESEHFAARIQERTANRDARDEMPADGADTR
mgnify:CR=1 FL=1